MTAAATTTEQAPKSENRPSQKPEEPRDIAALLRAMQAAQRKAGAPSYETRIARLDKLEEVLLRRKEEIAKTISEDFGNRSREESLVAEVFITRNAIKHARDHLRDWMEPEPREVGWTFLPARTEVLMQPLGVIGIISPWNYPLQLALAPLVGALAAGNRAMIKPSEYVPRTGELLASMMREAFAEDEVTVVTGGAEVGEAFARLPFDHLIFTGSTKIGKLVMRAASENLTPVTLELGGKSPAIVSDDFSIDEAATRIMMGKLFNAGQTCIAPDYVFVPKDKVAAFVEGCRAAVTKMYPRLADNPDYTSIIHERHVERLRGYIDDAKKQGAEVVELNPAKEDFEGGKKVAPAIVIEPSDDATVMQDEIFGPILPVKGYEKLDDAIDYVNEHPRPLALYYFGHGQERIDRVLEETISGGVCVNETMLHVAQDDLPFGGVGPSGMGHYHAREGFEALTKKKPVFYQSRINAMGMLRPPYGKTLDVLLKFLVGK